MRTRCKYFHMSHNQLRLFYNTPFHLLANRTFTAFEHALSGRKGCTVWFKTDVINNPQHNETQLMSKSRYSQQTWQPSLWRWEGKQCCLTHKHREKSYYIVWNYCQTELTDKIEGRAKKQTESVLSPGVGYISKNCFCTVLPVYFVHLCCWKF